ncbi:M16 family metallopeptidase [Sphingosinicella terrae]|jgi:predicted Zn-dependent peptidase|uniref:M16 family metallopeptidase n=1 Tax=Sphingosinicella terrae TaxID=2172047 RepID=UPI000E0D2D73|nr:pitrilysin family protein [Sphingosinicella terrae]
MMKLTILDSGLRVASRTMPSVETVAVGLYADAGSRHEPARLNGIAHLFEHMVFKGAGTRSAREISEAIEDVGGDLNASTDREGTSFTASLLAEHLPLGIELIADLVLRPRFDPADLIREKEVVLQELGEARDTPSDIIFDELWSAAYPDQPLGRSVLGEETSIAAIGVDDLYDWQRGQYRAGSLYLVAAGKVDHDALVRLAEAHFAGLPQGSIAAPEPARFIGGVRAGRGRADQAHLAAAFAGPAQGDPDHYAARLFADLVGGGASSRLFQAVREDRGLAYSVWASLQPYRDSGIFHFYAATARREAAAAAALIQDVVAEAVETATRREFERVRIQAKAGLMMSLESSWGQAAYVARQLSVRGRLVEPREVLAELETVTLDDVRAAGARMLAGPRASATIGLPAVRAA